MVLEGSSLVEALPPSRCVALGKKAAIGTLVTQLQSRTGQGSSDQFAGGSLRATFSLGQGVPMGSKRQTRRREVRVPALAATALADLLKLFYLQSHPHSDFRGSPPQLAA